MQALRKFRCDNGGWFARDVQKLIRRQVASAVASGTSPAQIIVFEQDHEMVAVAALEIHGSICDLHVIAIANAHHGSHVQTSAGDQPLVKVVLDTVLQIGRDLEATQARALVARRNTRSVRLLALEGFVLLRGIDQDYDEYAARLA